MISKEQIEKLAAEVHGVYCRAYQERFNKPYWTGGDYSKLEEATKEYDRAFVRWHLIRVERLQSEVVSLRLLLETNKYLHSVVLDDNARARELFPAFRKGIARLESELKECRDALQDQKRRWLDIPGGIDEDADENNTSPEDAGQHAAGLAVKAIDAVLPLLKEKT
ncbi:MAG: hypothetical protein KJ954_14365 [Alphaproteobacteria bacterium]|nr:hypothetical protein [Alphaproteobacteria bacterium]